MERKSLIKEGKQYLLYADKDSTLEVVAYEVIGRGANAIAYRGMIDGKCCVIKEAFPEATHGEVYYVRENDGEEARLVVKDRIPKEEHANLIEKEKERIYRCVKRECYVAGKMFCDGVNNSPYVYSAKTLRDYGKENDCFYAVLDTREGKTLKKIIRDHGGRLSFEKAIDYLRKILEVIRTLLRDEYCHADIKPDNIWVQGKNENEAVVLIDLGSAFGHSEFLISDNATDEEYVECAKKVLIFPGIGSSSEGYQSEGLKILSQRKKDFIYSKERRLVQNAYKFIEAIHNVGVKDDLYSTLQTFFVMLTGKLYIADGSINIESISERTGLEKNITKYLFDIMEHNEEGYNTIEELEQDLDILCKIYKKGVHPEVLIEKLQKHSFSDIHIEKNLLADVD